MGDRKNHHPKRKRNKVYSETRDFLALYEKYVQGLRPGSNGNYSGFCPLHGEIPGKSKSASLSIRIDTGLWNCFSGCGGGTASTFLTKMGLNRTEIDIEVDNLPKIRTNRSKRVKSEKEVTILPEKLLGVFDYCPTSLLKEGFNKKILHSHDIGYDKKLNRITFPIRTKTGELVGIVGRHQNPNPKFGKYKVYTTELLDYGLIVQALKKSNYLWRADKIHNLLMKKRRGDIFVVEGFKAALWFVQSGIEFVVALMGSHLSSMQQQELEHYGQRIILCLDNDEAGRKATLNIGHKLSATTRLVVPLPEGINQPDDLEEGELRDLVRAPKTISEVKKKWREYR